MIWVKSFRSSSLIFLAFLAHVYVFKRKMLLLYMSYWDILFCQLHLYCHPHMLAWTLDIIYWLWNLLCCQALSGRLEQLWSVCTGSAGNALTNPCDLGKIWYITYDCCCIVLAFEPDLPLLSVVLYWSMLYQMHDCMIVCMYITYVVSPWLVWQYCY